MVDWVAKFHWDSPKAQKVSRLIIDVSITTMSLHWRHNDHDGVSNHQPHGCLLNHLFRRRSKKTPTLRVTGLCVGIHRDRWIPRTKGQLRGKCFHLVTSSWCCSYPDILWHTWEKFRFSRDASYPDQTSLFYSFYTCQSIIKWGRDLSEYVFSLIKLYVFVSFHTKLAVTYKRTCMHLGYTPTYLRHDDGCRWPCYKLAPGHQQQPCWLDCHILSYISYQSRIHT